MGKIDIRNLQVYEDEPTEQKFKQKKDCAMCEA